MLHYLQYPRDPPLQFIDTIALRTRFAGSSLQGKDVNPVLLAVPCVQTAYDGERRTSRRPDSATQRGVAAVVSRPCTRQGIAHIGLDKY